MDQSKLEECYRQIFDDMENDFRFGNIAKFLLQKVGKGNILDVGCGSGFFSVKLALKGNKVLGIDYSSEMIRLALKRKQRLSLEKLNFLRIKAEDLSKVDGEYNYILFLDVLEHIKNDDYVVDQAIKKLKKHGKIIVISPALSQLYGKRDKSIGHFRRYSKKNLLKLFSKPELKSENIFYWNFIGLLPYFLWEKILKKPVKEDFRYKNGSRGGLTKKILKSILNFEMKLHPPVGLSLVYIIEKK